MSDTAELSLSALEHRADFDLLGACGEALDAADRYVEAAREAVASLVGPRADAATLDQHQFALHGLAWSATYVEALRQLLGWARRVEQDETLGAVEEAILQSGFAEYLAQLAGGIPISQGEFVRPRDLGIDEAGQALVRSPAVSVLTRTGNTAQLRSRLAELVAAGQFGESGIMDESLQLVRDQFRRFAEERVAPHAHEWHRKDELIPISIVQQMSDLGVFGLTVPEEHGGLGLGKMAMCIVSEELSRGYIGVGSLGTRAEIAAELIRIAGTAEQRDQWLPRIATGEVLPTAVFTEPDTGSDLASLRTRAVRDGDVYRIYGNKTWITHGGRSDVMTLLARTDPNEPGHRGLSMFIAPKPRGTEGDPFPAAGMSGGEIPVLGYRGMKEYEISFDGFVVDAGNLLGGIEGQGFRQLMTTFESARIQTAARALGVAQNALELAVGYAVERKQFGQALLNFPRVSGKIAWMAVETMIARQLTYFAARTKDADKRCDIEAGMAKLLAARVAWANADNALQIHGGNGYAQEYPISRVLCDARILNIFEGAAEIQAQVIGRGLLNRRN